jgi:hypothetical protein
MRSLVEEAVLQHCKRSREGGLRIGEHTPLSLSLSLSFEDLTVHPHLLFLFLPEKSIHIMAQTFSNLYPA